MRWPDLAVGQSPEHLNSSQQLVFRFGLSCDRSGVEFGLSYERSGVEFGLSYERSGVKVRVKLCDDMGQSNPGEALTFKSSAHRSL
jgi:hypothetical protein